MIYSTTQYDAIIPSLLKTRVSNRFWDRQQLTQTPFDWKVITNTTHSPTPTTPRHRSIYKHVSNLPSWPIDTMMTTTTTATTTTQMGLNNDDDGNNGDNDDDDDNNSNEFDQGFLDLYNSSNTNNSTTTRTIKTKSTTAQQQQLPQKRIKTSISTHQDGHSYAFRLLARNLFGHNKINVALDPQPQRQM